MTERDRKQQVLQAEEAILQLADQLALARQSRLAADETAEKLHAAQVVLELTQASLQDTMRLLTENTQRSSFALAEARDHLEKAQRQVAQVCNEVRALTQQVGELTPTLQRYLEARLGDVANGVHLASQGQELLRKDILVLSRLTWTVLVLSLLAFGAALTALLLLSLRLV